MISRSVKVLTFIFILICMPTMSKIEKKSVHNNSIVQPTIYTQTSYLIIIKVDVIDCQIYTHDISCIVLVVSYIILFLLCLAEKCVHSTYSTVKSMQERLILCPKMFESDFSRFSYMEVNNECA